MTTPDSIPPRPLVNAEETEQRVRLTLDHNYRKIVNGACVLCEKRHDSDVGPELVLEATGEMVCFECGEEHAPYLVHVLETLHDDKERGRLAQDKKLLLERYATRTPKRFHQLDCHGRAPGDYLSPDEDGHAMTGGSTVELMYGARVRVLIGWDESPADAAVMLRKLADFCETGWVMQDPFSNRASDGSFLL